MNITPCQPDDTDPDGADNDGGPVLPLYPTGAGRFGAVHDPYLRERAPRAGCMDSREAVRRKLGAPALAACQRHAGVPAPGQSAMFADRLGQLGFQPARDRRERLETPILST